VRTDDVTATLRAIRTVHLLRDEARKCRLESFASKSFIVTPMCVAAALWR
jgi:hypothetical protein